MIAHLFLLALASLPGATAVTGPVPPSPKLTKEQWRNQEIAKKKRVEERHARSEALQAKVKELKQEALSHSHGAVELVSHGSAQQGKAYITMWVETESRGYEDGDEKLKSLAQQLKSVGSKYPLIVMTNRDEIDVREDLYSIVPMTEHHVNFAGCDSPQARSSGALPRLHAFGMTTFDKLVWLDLDMKVQQNIDHLFELDTQQGDKIHGQSWKCDGHAEEGFEEGDINPGLMVFTPTHHNLKTLVKRAGVGGNCNDAAIINEFFGHGESAESLDKGEVAYSACKGGMHAKVLHQIQKQRVGPAGLSQKKMQAGLKVVKK